MTTSTQVDGSVIAEEIAAWLRLQVTESGASTLVLGMSGGIDSAVVCALAVRAVGPESVVAALMPINSRSEDMEDAEHVARACGVAPLHIDLSDTYETFLAAMPDAETRLPLALANAKPRLRMATLYYLANQHNGLVVGTGNKTELAIGYFTKYGDGGVDLLPIGDLDKTMVRVLARALAVPEQIIQKAPSAGLWEGQTDEVEIGLSYDTLDTALAALAAGDDDGIESGVRERIGALVTSSEHKRRPVPIFRRAETPR
jgi:NAD+ synthase